MVHDQSGIEMRVDGRPVVVHVEGGSLLDALRDELKIVSVKDGCSPQGQCGCCTVLVDGQPRVACVTPARRVAGREITTLAGLPPDERAAWAGAFCETGASQCGFCTPGIVVRLAALDAKLGRRHAATTGETIQADERSAVDRALLAHLCRCTGWQTISEAWDLVRSSSASPVSERAEATDWAAGGDRDLEAAARRAEIEGGVFQRVGPEVALGLGGFAADTVPAGALVAVAGPDGAWVVGDTVSAARQAAGKVQGRRTTADHTWPLDVPEGDWAATLRTTWVEPAYLETDASWCEPGGTPYSTVANGGAFGAKGSSPVTEAARQLADEHERPVLAIASREDATRWGPKRPPVAGGVDGDGRGVLRVVATEGIAEAIAAIAPALAVEEVSVAGPSTSAAIRAGGWAEAAVLLAGARGDDAPRVVAPNGAEATAAIVDGAIEVSVRCGRVLDPIVLRSYCIGAAHMAWSWVTSEAITVDRDGVIADLTVRSFGVVRAIDMPPVGVSIVEDDGAPINGSDAVFAAVAAATWVSAGCQQDWPIG